MKALVISAVSALFCGAMAGQAVSLPGYLTDSSQVSDGQTIRQEDPAMVAYRATMDAAGPSQAALLIPASAVEAAPPSEPQPQLEPVVLSTADAEAQAEAALDESTIAARAYAANWTPPRPEAPQPSRWDQAVQPVSATVQPQAQATDAAPPSGAADRQPSAATFTTASAD